MLGQITTELLAAGRPRFGCGHLREGNVGQGGRCLTCHRERAREWWRLHHGGGVHGNRKGFIWEHPDYDPRIRSYGTLNNFAKLRDGIALTKSALNALVAKKLAFYDEILGFHRCEPMALAAFKAAERGVIA